MSDLIGSLRRAVHDTSGALIDNDIPTKVSDMVTASVKSGFDIVENLLTIVKDLTAESEPTALRSSRKAARRPAR
jgi:hypothetical protein